MRTDPSLFIDDPAPASGLSVDDRKPVGLRTPRSDAYLLWRFASHPTARYFRVDKDDSTAVVRPNHRNGRRELVLADVFGSRPADCHPQRCSQVSSRLHGWVVLSGSPERGASMRAGLMPVPGVRH